MGFDWAVLDFIQSIRTPFGDAVMPAISIIGNGGFIWIVLGAVLLLYPKTRRVGATIAIALVFTLVLSELTLKVIVARPRPFIVDSSVVPLVSPPPGFSFPSVHTASSFAAVGALFFSRNRLWIPALILAILIAFSRLYVYVHFPTDVLAGIAFGLLFGYLAHLIVSKIWKTPAGESDS